MGYKIIPVLIFSILFFGCSKTSKEEWDPYKVCPAIFIITSTITPHFGSLSSGISSQIVSEAYDGCHGFSNTDIKKVSPFVYEIRSVGKVLCNAGACPQNVVVARDTIHIETQQPGIYILGFYNYYTRLFKSDTITIQ